MEINMKKTLLRLSVLFIGFGLLSSCIIVVVDIPGSLTVRPFEEFQRYEPFPSGGTLSLKNRDGRIEIFGWDREECEVYAERSIPYYLDRRFRILQHDRYVPAIEMDQFESFIKIQTIPAPAENATNIVDYSIRVPEAVNLKPIINRKGDITIADLYGDVEAETREGNVNVENFSGSLRVSVGAGNVEAALFDLRPEDEISLSTEEGHITLRLQQGVSADLEVFVPNGKIFSAFAAGEEKGTADKISVKLGMGGARISMTALNGDIRIEMID